MSTNSYFGIHPTIQDSVNSGLIVNNERSDEYHCYFKNSDDEGYDEGFICESDLNDLIAGRDWFTTQQVNDFLLELKQSKESFMDLTFIEKLNYMIAHFGSSDLFGKCIYRYTKEEVFSFVANYHD